MNVWDRPELLNSLSNAIFFVVAAAILYFGGRQLATLPLFNLQRVQIQGSFHYLAKEDLEQVVRQDIRGNFLTLNLQAVQAAIAALPWVRTVAVRRHWPRSLVIEITEHEPLAHWGHGGLVNQQGEVFAAEYSGELPEFDGPPGSAKELTQTYEQFRQVMQPLALWPRRVEMSPRRAWRVLLNNGLAMELGREEVLSRLQRFVAAYPYTIGRLFAGKLASLKTIDLRYANGFAVDSPEATRFAPKLAKPSVKKGQASTQTKKAAVIKPRQRDE